MNRRYNLGFLRVTMTLITSTLCLLSSPAQAHLMAAQHGTLNLVGSGAFLAVSVPVSAFDGVDDDGNGGLSMDEFAAHLDELEDAVVQKVRLFDEQGARALEGLMLSPSLPHTDRSGSAAHLMVMGRFALREEADLLRFETSLFGEEADERSLQITATRRATDQRQVLELTPSTPGRALFR